jgi:hypothetical protein
MHRTTLGFVALVYHQEVKPASQAGKQCQHQQQYQRF